MAADLVDRAWPAGQAYAYPAHLRECAGELPEAPGVYVFHGEPEDQLPLYIGKSVRIRSRVLSHLRNPEEAALLRQARRISYTLTAGEVGALLLEAQMIKQLQPPHNRRLRASRQLYGWRWIDAADAVDGVPRLELVHAGELDFAHTPDLFGLYRSRQAARGHLAELADQHGLCLQAIGVEAGRAGRPCFRHAIRRCAGACAGVVSAQDHAQAWQMALASLRLRTWPFPSAVGLQERHGAMRQIHVVRDWCYLGSAGTLAAARRLTRVPARYDVDTYRILVGPLLDPEARLTPL